MTDLEFSFEPTPWEAYLSARQAGDRIPAVDLLAMLEDQDEQELEQALSQLETGCFQLDLTGMPRNCVSGEAALRLKEELELTEKGPISPEDFEKGDPLRIFLEEVASLPAQGEEQSLAERYCKGEESVGQMLTNLGLSRVIELSQAHAGYGVLILDLIQEGSLGLWQAIRNYRCGDYCALRDKWIRFYLARAITLQAKSSGIGQKMLQALEDYQAIDQRLLAELGRNPTVEEISLELHMTLDETETVKKMLENAQILAKIRKPQDSPEEKEAEDQPVEDTAYFQMRSRIVEMLSSLSQEDAKLLTLRFGLEGGQPMSPEETGKIMNLTPSQVLKREQAALSQLRDEQ